MSETIGLDWNAPLVNRLRLAPICLSNVGDNAAKIMNEAADEIERLRAALQRIADDDVDADLKGRADILSGIAWAALNATEQI